MQQYQTSNEIIKEAEELFNKNPFSDLMNKPYYIIGYLQSHYDELLKSISEDIRNKFTVAKPDDPTYEDILEEHDGFENDKKEAKKISDNLFNTIAQITKDHAKKNYGIDINLKTI